MITEKQLRAWKNAGLPPNEQAHWSEVIDSLEKLWKVARAARRWTKATPGRPATEAEAEMMDALDALNVGHEEAHEISTAIPSDS